MTPKSKIITATSIPFLLALVVVVNYLAPMGKRLEIVDINAPPCDSVYVLESEVFDFVYNPDSESLCGKLRLHLKSGYLEINLYEPNMTEFFISGIMSKEGLGFFREWEINDPDTVVHCKVELRPEQSEEIRRE